MMGEKIPQGLKMRKDGDSAQIKNYGGSLQKHCERRIVGFWCHAWQVFSLSLKTSNCRECNCSESTQSPSSHPFHLNHSRFLLMPYLNHYCSNSGPSGLILPTTETDHFRPQQQPLEDLKTCPSRGILFSEQNTISSLHPVTGCVFQMSEPSLVLSDELSPGDYVSPGILHAE